MSLTSQQQALRKKIYQRLKDEPLSPDHPLYHELYQPVYEAPGCEDPVQLLQDHIELVGSESMQMFSGFRGSGKTTELFRLQKRLKEQGYVVLYADALDYVSPSEEIDITDLLIVLAGAFSDALQEWAVEINEEVELTHENFWTRITNYLTRTTTRLSEINVSAELSSLAQELLGGIKAGIDLKLAIKESPSFRHKVRQLMQNRIPDLRASVHGFFQDGVKAVKRAWGEEKEVVFIFDSLEQLRGSLSNEQAVLRSVERLFADHLNLLRLPHVHVVYTVPPWLQFVMPNAVELYMLPSVCQWKNDAGRSRHDAGWDALRKIVFRRIGREGCETFFACEPGQERFTGADELVAVCGGHFRDLLILLRETFLRARSAPVQAEVFKDAIASVRSNFLPISIADAEWLNKIGESRTTELPNNDPENVSRLTRFLDTHFVLYLTNGSEWYDLHPLVRDEVAEIVRRRAASAPVEKTETQ